MVTEVRPEQPVKALLPIVITPSEIVIDVSPVQPENAKSPIAVTLLGMVTEVRLEQPVKALLPIDVTLLGIVTEVRREQSKKALPQISVNPVKYCSSSKEVMILAFFLKIDPRSVTVAASDILNSPSPSVSQFSTQMVLTASSLNVIISPPTSSLFIADSGP